MNCHRPKTDGLGYPWTACRIEWRPQYHLHSREELVDAMDLFVECGIKAWWYSVAARGSFPLYSSKYLPYRQDVSDVDPDIFPWLTRESHARDLSIFSWEYLNTAPLVVDQHPDWRMVPFDCADTLSPRDKHYVCYNSPYGNLLMKYCVEVIGDLGFDGIWFDGCYLHIPERDRVVCCCCNFCADKYKQETGYDFPTRVDVSDSAFKRYMQWRYDDYEDYWRSLSGYVRDHCPDAVIVLNYFNRLGFGWNSGSALRSMPMEGMIAGEVDLMPQQLLLQHKMLRAINGNYPTEVWRTLSDGAQYGSWQGQIEPDPTSAIYHGQISATAGGFASYGLEQHSPMAVKSTLKELAEALNPIAPYVGGDPVRCIGLVVSNATHDFSQDDLTLEIWQSVHGVHNLLNALHIPSDILFDDRLNSEVLKQYQAIVLPNIECMSDATAEALSDYVAQGGYLVAIGETGTKTELGEHRDRGVLDDLFGIERRHDQVVYPVMCVCWSQLHGVGLPERYKISGPAKLVDVSSGEILAQAEYEPEGGDAQWDGQGWSKPQVKSKLAAAIVAHDVGRGRAVCVTQNIGLGYAQSPHRRSRLLIGRLLCDRIDLPFTTDAAPLVVVVPWRQNNRMVFHLLNQPATMVQIRAQGKLLSAPALWPEDFTPTGPIRINLRGEWSKASSPSHRESLSYTCDGDGIEMTLMWFREACDCGGRIT